MAGADRVGAWMDSYIKMDGLAVITLSHCQNTNFCHMIKTHIDMSIVHTCMHLRHVLSNCAVLLLSTTLLVIQLFYGRFHFVLECLVLTCLDGESQSTFIS